ncbi:MAG: FAD-dependent monooxygenase [Saprospiraceae bacterium]|nr:FAD-dependent monooxygenase [Candidatus Brachybacter algidus]
MEKETYDCGIIGAGLAGLSAAILLSRLGYKVLVMEQKQFPMHKVCGEYVSMESYDFLENLGLPLSKMDLPMIRNVNISAPNGSMLSQELDLGGFGISRYLLDDLLAKKSVECGATLKENTKVFDVRYKDEKFEIFTNNGNFVTKLCIGSFGKYPLFSMRHIKKASIT